VTKPGSSPQYDDVSEQDRPPGSGLEEFDAIYERELDYVWRTLGRLGVPQSDRDDAAHDVFVVLHRKWNEIDRARSLRPWLFGVARRIASDLRAKRRETPSTIEAVAEEDSLAAQRDMLWRGMAALDEDRRTVLILHDLEGHTGAEIAELLEIPANTVHSRLRLARADLLAAVRKLRGEP
jgi:RNA polymerase sigma-70 factor, ECF subfamily